MPQFVIRKTRLCALVTDKNELKKIVGKEFQVETIKKRLIEVVTLE